MQLEGALLKNEKKTKHRKQQEIQKKSKKKKARKEKNGKKERIGKTKKQKNTKNKETEKNHPRGGVEVRGGGGSPATRTRTGNLPVSTLPGLQPAKWGVLQPAVLPLHHGRSLHTTPSLLLCFK